MGRLFPVTDVNPSIEKAGCVCRRSLDLRMHFQHCIWHSFVGPKLHHQKPMRRELSNDALPPGRLKRLMRKLACPILRGVAAAGIVASFTTATVGAEIIALDRPDPDLGTASNAVPSSPVKCDVQLSGAIEPGDADRFKTVVSTLKQDHRGRTIFVCLNSKGGNVREALAIARYIRWLGPDPTRNLTFVAGFDSAIVTIVDAHSTCASACTFIFLAGSALTSPARFLHPKGRLIFHASFLSFNPDVLQLLFAQDRDRLQRDLDQLYGDGLEDFRQIIDLFNSAPTRRGDLIAPWVRPSLFLESFAHDPAELLCIDNVDQVGRWNIQLLGISVPKQVNKPMLRNVCENAFYWRQDTSALQPKGLSNEELPVFFPPLDQDIGGRNVWSEGFDFRGTVVGRNYAQCVVEMTTDAPVKVFYTNSSDRPVSIIESAAASAFLAPNTVLSDLDADPNRLDAPSVDPASGKQSMVEFRTYQNRTMSGCNLSRLSESDLDNCKKACEVTAECSAYSFNKVERVCELKHTLTAVRIDPLWSTGVRVSISGETLPSSRRALVLTSPLPEPRGEHFGRDLIGEQKQVLSLSSRDQCANACAYDNNCLGYSYFDQDAPRDSGQCQLFSDISDVHPGYGYSEVKRQQ
ncbi:PAN domain-containing protein [Bradyrhizobium diazoefficiens]|uniref:PAN domain-containing protein n=1 Tax=Bradyrhizobium diazoefficiens TaxID=1355477 RepID=UPI0004B4BBD4|nr:PAN domain-containing protein [Bradyrhizobium diazoefficiens]